MHHHEGFADFGQHAHRRGASAHIGPAAAVGAHAAGQQQFRAAVELLHLGAGLPGPRDGGVAGVELQHGLRRGALRAAADGAGVGPGTEEQPDGGDHHGLAGAGFTGHHAEARAQRQGGVGDDAEVADSQFFKHGSLLG